MPGSCGSRHAASEEGFARLQLLHLTHACMQRLMIEHQMQLHGRPTGLPAAANGAVIPATGPPPLCTLPPRRLCASCSPLPKLPSFLPNSSWCLTPPHQGTMRAAALLLALLAGAAAVQGAQADATLLLCSRSCSLPPRAGTAATSRAAASQQASALAVAAVLPPPPPLPLLPPLTQPHFVCFP